MAALTKITTIRDFERELPSITKIFSGDESDRNWEARERALTTIRDLIRSQALSTEWKDLLAKTVQTISDGLARSVNSLRTVLALAAITTVGDISTYLGYMINAFTIDLLLISLLRCSSTTKKVIATHAMNATTKLLSSTPYRQRSLQHLCNMMEEKNMQARHYAALYIKTLLTTHGANVSMTGKSTGLDMIDKCIRKGLLDASPHVRDASRNIYVLLQQYWPARALRLHQSLDVATQAKLSRLGDASPGYTSATDSQQPRPSTAPSSREIRPVRPRLTSQATGSTIEPLSHRSTPSISTSLSSIARRPRPSTANVVTIPSKRRRAELTKDNNSNSDGTAESRRSSMASVSIASSSANDTTRPNGSYLAAASLLQMLRSNDTATNCKGIYRLASKLKQCPYKHSQTPVLPQDVPSFTTLYPLVMNYLSRDTDNTEFHETLVSWDCLAGVFTRILSLHHYVPPIILASQGYKRVDGKTSLAIPSTMSHIYAKGAARLKIYLKRCDSELPGRLLSIFTASLELGYPSKYRHSLIQWIDELLCEYVGLLDDDDDDDNSEGDIRKGSDEWIAAAHLDEQRMAYQWFDDEANTKRCLSTILPILENMAEDAEEYSTLLVLVGRLRMSNERVFDTIAHQYGRALERLTASRPSLSDDCQRTSALDEFDTSLGSIRLQDDDPMASEVHTDATQEFSGLLVSAAIKEATNSDGNYCSEINLSKLEDGVVMTKGPASWSRELSGLMQCLQQQQEGGSDIDVGLILKRLQVVSDATPVLQHEHIYSAQGDMWIGSPGRGRYFLSLMEILIGFLLSPLSPSHKGQVKILAIILIKQVLMNQAGILSYYEQRCLNSSKKEDKGATNTSNESVSYALAKALLSVSAGAENAEDRKEMATCARETLELLMLKVPEDASVRMIWALLGDEQIAQDTDAATLLFSRLGILAPGISRELWSELLRDGNTKILIQGTNHCQATVRRACVQAIVGIYKVMGEVLLIDELAPSLRVDQIELLKHYIHKKK